MKRSHFVGRAGIRTGLIVVTLAILFGMTSRSATAQAGGTLTLTFTYGSEKEEWVKEVTKAFNASGRRTPGGRAIVVEAIAMGSGETMQEIVEGKRQTHLVSPASRIFIDLANARSADDVPLVRSPQSVVVSPVVVAMWKPMAEALGWGQQPVGWAEMIDLMKDPKGWERYDFPKWGKFKFGHTHPEYSNSGLLALVAMAYAGAGKTRDLTVADVDRPQTAQLLREVQQSVVHYGSSTGFFGRKMFAGGPAYLSAAVLYENMVIESYDPKHKLPHPIVAVYPKEGTFWSDHPVGVVQKAWVTLEHRAAGEIYIKYLLERPQQEKAMKYGFRPADSTIPLGPQFVPAYGVDAKEPKALLPVPTRDVTEKILALWKRQKKQANVVIAFDISGSMNEEQRMERARPAAAQLLEMLGDDDRLSFLTFGTDVQWKFKDAPVRERRDAAMQMVQGLKAFGKTALHDAVAEAYDHAAKSAKPGMMSIVVVLSDGADTSSKLSAAQMLEKLKFDPERQPTLVFTIGYGGEADDRTMQAVSDATQARFYKGTPENIRKVLEDNAAFFGAGARAK